MTQRSHDGFDLPTRSIQRIVIDVEPGNEVDVEEGYVGYIGTQARVIAAGKPGDTLAQQRDAARAERDAYAAQLERYDGQAWEDLQAERDAAVARAEQAERDRDRALDLAQKNGEASAEHYGRALDAEQAVARARELHRPYRIYDECDHRHEYTEDGGLPEGVVEVDDIGLTCLDNYMYSICFECCTGGSGFQTEECIDHRHGPDVIHCDTIRALDGPAAPKEDSDG